MLSIHNLGPHKQNTYAVICN